MTEQTDTAASATQNSAQPPAAAAPAPQAPATPQDHAQPAPTPSAAAAPSPPAAQPATPPHGDNLAWLPERLAQAKRTATTELLQALGLKDTDELKNRLGELDTLKKASMSEAERRDAELAELKPKAEKVGQYETIIRARVVAELADLTNEQRAAVQALAGDDPARTLQTIDALKPTWEKAKQDGAPAAPTAQAQPASAATPVAANTAPARGAAPTETNESPPNHKTIWEQLEKTNPFSAAAYFQAHKAEIFPSGS